MYAPQPFNSASFFHTKCANGLVMFWNAVWAWVPCVEKELTKFFIPKFGNLAQKNRLLFWAGKILKIKISPRWGLGRFALWIMKHTPSLERGKCKVKGGCWVRDWSGAPFFAGRESHPPPETGTPFAKPKPCKGGQNTAKKDCNG